MFFAKYIYIALFLSTVAGSAFAYHKSTQATIIRLTNQAAAYKVALDTAQASMKNLKTEMAKQQETNSALSKSLAKSEERLGELRSKFANHDLTKLAVAKPGLIEKRINGGTQKVFTELEELSKDERAAPK